MPVPNAAPQATTLVGNARPRSPNHLYTACTATGKEGPSAAPSRMRLVSSAANPDTTLMGNSAADQATPIHPMMDLVRTRFARKPTATPEAENSRKKALPSIPNWTWLRPSSRMMGTLDRPTTALSA